MIQLGEEIHPPISTPMEWLGISCDLYEFSLHIYKMKKSNSVFCIPGVSLVAQMVKNLLQWDPGLIPGLGRSPGEGNGYPLQSFCLENSMDREAWRATAHGVTKSHNWATNSLALTLQPRRVSALLGKVYLPTLCSHLSGLCFHLAWLSKVISQRR